MKVFFEVHPGDEQTDVMSGRVTFEAIWQRWKAFIQKSNNIFPIIA